MKAIFLFFLSLSVSGSVLAVCWLAARPLLKGRLSYAWQYALWLIILLRFLLPFTPQASVMNQAARVIQEGPPGVVAPLEPRPGASGEEGASPPAPTPPANSGGVPSGQVGAALPWRELGEHLWIPWVGVALVLFVHKVASYRSFSRFVRVGAKRVAPGPVLTLFEEAQREAGIRPRKGGPPLPLYLNQQVSSPMLVGLLRPAVILPPLALGDDQLRDIFRHELVHYRRRDFLYKWLVQVTLCLHWFNPLLYKIQREISRCCELSCDEAVIRERPQEERFTYGDALMASLKAKGHYSDFVVSITMSENATLVKERLDAIMNFTKQKKWMAAMGVALAVLLFTGGYALGAYNTPPAPADPAGGGATGQGDWPMEEMLSTAKPLIYDYFDAKIDPALPEEERLVDYALQTIELVAANPNDPLAEYCVGVWHDYTREGMDIVAGLTEVDNGDGTYTYLGYYLDFRIARQPDGTCAIIAAGRGPEYSEGLTPVAKAEPDPWQNNFVVEELLRDGVPMEIPYQGMGTLRFLIPKAFEGQLKVVYDTGTLAQGYSHPVEIWMDVPSDEPILSLVLVERAVYDQDIAPAMGDPDLEIPTSSGPLALQIWPVPYNPVTQEDTVAWELMNSRYSDLRTTMAFSMEWVPEG